MNTFALPALSPSTPRSRQPLWRRLGVLGFTFFLVKGLLWLAVPTLLWMVRG